MYKVKQLNKVVNQNMSLYLVYIRYFSTVSIFVTFTPLSLSQTTLLLLILLPPQSPMGRDLIAELYSFITALLMSLLHLRICPAVCSHTRNHSYMMNHSRRLPQTWLKYVFNRNIFERKYQLDPLESLCISDILCLSITFPNCIDAEIQHLVDLTKPNNNH